MSFGSFLAIAWGKASNAARSTAAALADAGDQAVKTAVKAYQDTKAATVQQYNDTKAVTIQKYNDAKEAAIYAGKVTKTAAIQGYKDAKSITVISKNVALLVVKAKLLSLPLILSQALPLLGHTYEPPPNSRYGSKLENSSVETCPLLAQSIKERNETEDNARKALVEQARARARMYPEPKRSEILKLANNIERNSKALSLVFCHRHVNPVRA